MSKSTDPSPPGSGPIDPHAGIAGPTPATAGAAAAAASPMAVALAVAVAHGVNDAYSAFLHPLLPRIMTRLGLNITLAATLAMTLSLSASLVQPIMGHWADRYGRRAFVIAGPLLSGVFMSLIGVAPTFAWLCVCLALGGLGSAAFHPPGASLAGRAGGGKGGGTRLSFFSFGGSAGYAVGPMAAVGIVSLVGLDNMWLAMIPVLVLTVVLLRVLPPDPPPVEAQPAPRPRELLALFGGPLGLVFGISAVGAFVQRVFLTMEPIIVNAAGGSEALGALALSCYLAGQAGGSLVGGMLADRMDRRLLLAALTLLALPAHLLALWLAPGSVPALAAAVVAGMLGMSLIPPVVLTAQEVLPARAALGSGIVMGLAWATGSVAVLGAGVLGDALGARNAALVVMPVLLVGTVLALAIPSSRGGPALRPS